MSRFTNDIDTIGEMLNTTLIQIVSGAITIAGTIILMLYTSPVLGLITIAATPVLTWLSKTIMKKGQKAYTGAAEKSWHAERIYRRNSDRPEGCQGV